MTGLPKRSLFYLEMLNFYGYLSVFARTQNLQFPGQQKQMDCKFNNIHFQMLIIFYIYFFLAEDLFSTLCCMVTVP